MKTLEIVKSTHAKNIWFDETRMFILLEDGREISIPLEWFPKLRDASITQLQDWRLIGRGEGIHWEALDEDILVEALII